MELARVSIVGWAVATIVVGTAITGCSDEPKSPWVPGPGSYPHPSSTSSSAAHSSTTSSSATPSSTSSSTVTAPPPVQPTDYSSLLIKASDIGPDMTTPQPPVLNPNNAPGVAQLFTNSDNSRRIGVTILILDDPVAAAGGVANTKENYAGRVTGTWQPVDVGSNGSMISGTSPDNPQAVTVLLFTEGKALVNLEFDSAPNDPIPPALAIDVGRKQEATIKAGLPS